MLTSVDTYQFMMIMIIMMMKWVTQHLIIQVFAEVLCIELHLIYSNIVIEVVNML